MDDNTANSLDKILEKLSSVEAELGRVRRRLDALEAGSETPLESPDLPVDAVRPVVELDKKQQTPASPPPLKQPAAKPAPGIAPTPASPPRLPPMPVVPPAAAVGPEPDVPPGPVLPQRQSQAPSAVALHRAQ